VTHEHTVRMIDRSLLSIVLGDEVPENECQIALAYSAATSPSRCTGSSGAPDSLQVAWRAFDSSQGVDAPVVLKDGRHGRDTVVNAAKVRGVHSCQAPQDAGAIVEAGHARIVVVCSPSAVLRGLEHRAKGA
jgi:hypothetical protein